MEDFLDGAYRPHKPKDVARFTQLARDAFPDFASRIECFGADWLGRQFATDTDRIVGGEPQVLMLEPGTGEVLEIPVSRTEFHMTELAQYPDAVAAYPFFQNWLSRGGSRPDYSQCVGYRVPLFLGGEDEVSNLEICDFEVYWSVAAQLFDRVRRLPPGTPIGDISITD